MEQTVYNQEGKEVGKTSLPSELFELSWNPDLVHQVVVSMQSNARSNIAHTKDRGEVSGGGRKPHRQKGTGRARHGSIRSPIWRGGGITFGPRNEKSYVKKINKKMRTKALNTILSQKLKDNELLLLDALSFSETKTKQAKAVITSLSRIPLFEALASKKNNTALFVVPEKTAELARSFQNIGNVALDEIRNINPLRLLTYKYVVLADPIKSVSLLRERSARILKKETQPQAQKKEVAPRTLRTTSASVKKKTATAKQAPKKSVKK